MISDNFDMNVQNRQPLAGKNVSDFLPCAALKQNGLHNCDTTQTVHAHNNTVIHPAMFTLGLAFVESVQRNTGHHPIRKGLWQQHALFDLVGGVSSLANRATARSTPTFVGQPVNLVPKLEVRLQRCSPRLWAIRVPHLNDRNLHGLWYTTVTLMEELTITQPIVRKGRPQWGVMG